MFAESVNKGVYCASYLETGWNPGCFQVNRNLFDWSLCLTIFPAKRLPPSNTIVLVIIFKGEKIGASLCRWPFAIQEVAVWLFFELKLCCPQGCIEKVLEEHLQMRQISVLQVLCSNKTVTQEGSAISIFGGS